MVLPQSCQSLEEEQSRKRIGLGIDFPTKERVLNLGTGFPTKEPRSRILYQPRRRPCRGIQDFFWDLVEEDLLEDEEDLDLPSRVLVLVVCRRGRVPFLSNLVKWARLSRLGRQHR